MSFLFVPAYLKFIGTEGYGLVGFFVVLSTTLSLLDGGLGVTATRQTASFAEADAEGKKHITSLLRTIEVLFWVMAALGGVAVALAAPLIARHWLNVEPARIPEVTTGLRLMAVALVPQFPIAFYSGCLLGLQEQVKLNVINATVATLRGVGAVLALWLVSPTVFTFLVWQCVVSTVTVLWLAFSLRQLIGGQHGSWFHFASLRLVGTFTAGVWGINVLGYLLTQIDKIILSMVVPIEVFGYYTLAWTLGTFAYRFVVPIFNAYYPRITQLVTQGEQVQLADLHHNTELLNVYLKATRVMAIAIVPFSVWLAFFSRELLAMWTRNQTIAQESAGAMALIALGTMCNGFMHIPYGLQLASGKTSLAFWQNVVAVFLIAPLTYYCTIRYGLTGAALPWLLVNVGYVVISAQLMYRVMMRGAKWRWYTSSVLYPFLQATILIGLSYYAATQFTGRVVVLAVMLSGLFASVVIPVIRSGFIKVPNYIRNP
jgi:O-antigen/teichoic acid export membrane protein